MCGIGGGGGEEGPNVGAALGAWGEVGGGTAAAQTALNQRVSVLCLHDCPASPARRKSPHLGFCPGNAAGGGEQDGAGQWGPPCTPALG